MVIDPVPRKCIDWDSLQAWADERALNASDEGYFLSTLIPSHEPGSSGPADLMG